MASDNWLTPAQDNARLVQAINKFYKTTWEPINISKEEEKTYFNNQRKIEHHLQYDLYFSFSQPGPLYDQRKLIENRQFQPDIRENIFQQEWKKAVPVLTSLNYGKRRPYDRPEFQYNRIGQIPSFYRRNGAFPVSEKHVSSNSHEIPQLY